MTRAVPISQMSSDVAIDGPSGSVRSIFSTSDGVKRWEIRLGNATPETGSNSGSDFDLIPYDDLGVERPSVLSFNRATGTVVSSSLMTLSGGTMTGPLILSSDPTAALGAATKQYVDASMPIGSVIMYAGSATPTNYLLCDGSLRSTTTYAALFAKIGYTHGGSGASFALPNPQDRTVMGASVSAALGTTGGAANITLDATMIPAHSHPVTSPTHSHSATSPAHNHADAGHAHTASQVAHAHTLTGNPLTGTAGANAASGAGWAFTAVNTSSVQPAVTVNAAFAGLAATAVTVSVNAASAGITTTDPTGGGQPHSNIPPYIAFHFLIKYQ